MARRIAAVEVLPGVIVRVTDDKGREYVYVLEVEEEDLATFAEKVKDAVWSGALREFEDRFEDRLVISGRVR